MDEQVGYGLFQNQPENKNNLLSTRFRLLIKRLPVTTYMCQSVVLPGLSIGVAYQNTRHNRILRPAGEVSHQYLDATFIVDEDLSNWKEIRSWILQCSNYTDFTEYQQPSQHFSDDVTLTILTNTHNITHKVQFSNCFPVSLSEVLFDSSNPQSQVVIAKMSLAFSFYNIETV